MSTTPQILFNSPALHSLKRDKLVKLCKIHAIKASGKNVDLIQRLKDHAETLPKDDPLSIAVRGENNENEPDEDSEGSEPGTPSPEDHTTKRPPLAARMNDWEVVMYSIEEEDETATGTIRSTRSGNKATAGEFGTGSSKCSFFPLLFDHALMPFTVGSSIKSLANSLGKLKKGGNKTPMNLETKPESLVPPAIPDELERTSQPYSSIKGDADGLTEQEPLDPDTSLMDVDEVPGDGEAPLPGHALRPGVPAPADGRLSLGLGLGVPTTPNQPTTTVRLVGNKPKDASHLATPCLKPFNTSFDLIMGTPAPAGSLYPTLSFHDLPPSLTSLTKASSTSLPPSNGQSSSAMMNADAPKPLEAQAPEDPFIFGSPLPKHRVSDVQFKSAAASVLEEMNKRLLDEGVEGVDTALIERLHPGANTYKPSSPRDTKALPKTRTEMTEKFKQAHEQEFSKMEGIDAYAKRKAAVLQADTSRKTSVVVGKKRKSSVMSTTDGPRPIGAPRPGGTRVVSNGRRPPVRAPIPGAFGVDDDDDDEQDTEERAGKRIRVMSDGIDSKDDAQTAAGSAVHSVEDQRTEEEKRQAIKRKLEMNKAKRRSSTGPGMHGRRSGKLSARPSAGKFDS